MKKLIMLLVLTLFLTGCYNYRELSELAIASGLGIEYKDETFYVYLQIVNTSAFDSQSSSQESAFIVYEGKGNTLLQAIRDVNDSLPKQIFMHHLKILILDDSILTHTKEIVGFFMNELEINLTSHVVATYEVSPKDVLEIITPKEDINGVEISRLIEVNNKKLGIAYKSSIKDFISDYYTDGKDTTLSNIEIIKPNNEDNNIKENEESSETTKLYVDSLIAFNKAKTVLLENNEGFVLNLLTNNLTNNILTLECDGGYFTVETINSKFKMINFKNNTINIKGNYSTSIEDYTCSYDLDEIETFYKLKDIIKKNLYKKIDNAFLFSQNNEIDFLGFGAFVKDKDEEFYNKYKDNWNDLGLKNIRIVNSIEVDLIKQGNLKGDIK